jgi:hypothetical protein
MILASLKPYYYYLIGERKKTIEVRKSALKNLPQDIVFYMSKDEKSFAKIPKEFQEKYRKYFGKIGMRVICDEVDKWKYLPDCYSEDKDEKMYYISSADGAAACLTYDEIENYGESKTLYGWHISDLKIYDKPRELSEFRISCNRKNLCYSCNRFTGKPWDICNSTITRPPQSYMRVKELKEV